MKFTVFKNFKIFTLNLFITGLILIIIDLFLSKYFGYFPALNIPETFVEFEETFDTKEIEKSKKSTKSKYSRDKNGYRPFKSIDETNELIFTIGGSTTDQKYVDDEKTWQRIMEKSANISVINGGVEGQSSYGHLLAIKNWHAKVLPLEKVNKIIFYLGINDTRFSKSLETAKGNIYDSPNTFLRLKSYISRRSFLYSKLRKARFKFDVLRGTKLVSPDGITIAGHGTRNPIFLKNSIKSNIPLSNKDEIREYKELFSNLLKVSKSTFTNAEIYIVQQQDPKCRIERNSVFVNVTEKDIKNYCSSLASIFFAQEEVIKNLNKLSKLNISIIKMYKDNPISKEGFYDGIHTNIKGSSMIAEYLLKKIIY